MDKIQKMVIGVLSVAGFIALVIPQKDPISQTSDATVSDATPPPANMPPQPPAPLPVQFDPGPPSSFDVGAPTIDGKPMQPDFGMPFGTSSQTSQSNDAPNQNSQNGYTPPAYVMPGSTPEVQRDEEPAPAEGQAQ